MDAGVQPRRTIRFCLWSGEEQGLLGSRGYVESLTDEELDAELGIPHTASDEEETPIMDAS